MTIAAPLQGNAANVAVNVRQADEKNKWTEDGPELDESNDMNEMIPMTPERNEATPLGYVTPVAGTAETLPSRIVCEEPVSVAETKEPVPVVEKKELIPFSPEETILIFDWDDTILPSTWVQQQGLRLDEESTLSDAQRQELNEIANAAMETLRIAKQHGTVVFVTNAERGWIELSCQKFLPTLYPTLENIKLVSARTLYECETCVSPIDWKINAFSAEIALFFGDDIGCDAARRKNCLSLGDSMAEREALLRVTAKLPNCRSKSLKFVERPVISQICKQHALILGCFDKIVQHDGNLDICIKCA